MMITLYNEDIKMLQLNNQLYRQQRMDQYNIAFFPLQRFKFQKNNQSISLFIIQPNQRKRCQSVSTSNQCQNQYCQMNPHPSQTKTPKSKRNLSKPSQHSPSDPSHLISPQSIDRYLPSHPTQSKEDAHKSSESNIPTIYRKHQYSNKEFTQILDLKTGARTTRAKAPIKYTLSDFNEVAEIGSFLVNVSSLNAQTQYKKTQWKELHNTDTFCKCVKSQCLKNYCACRQKGTFCTSDCSCLNCKNRVKNQKEMEEKIQEERNRSRDKIKEKQSRPEQTKRLQQNDQGLTNICICKKGKNCPKSQCGCHRRGIKCSSQCQCSNCKN